MTKLVRCTAGALVIRSLPEIRPETDTGARMISGQVATAYGTSLDDAWLYVVAPAATGWVSGVYIEDAPTTQPEPLWPAVPHGIDAIRETFGDIREYIRADGTLLADWERTFITGRVKLPKSLPLSWAPSQRTTTIACHHVLEGVLQSVFDEIDRRDYWPLLEDFGGCFNFRSARGLQKLSTHAWGIAVDVAVRNNPLGARPRLDPRIVAIFEDHGFVWGGDWSRPDGMHFQYCSGY